MNVDLWAIQPGDRGKADLVERAARVCYRSSMAETKEQQHRFLTSLSERGHLSVFEHARYVWRAVLPGWSGVHQRYWSVRYGTSITDRTRYPIISMNARNYVERFGVNPVLFPDTIRELSGIRMMPFERMAHYSATFCISGISRACSHQLVRHRVMSFSQESQRYCDSGEWEPVVPPSVKDGPDVVRLTFVGSMLHAKRDYRELRYWNISKEDARFVLPNATPTTVVVTATFEHWLHFLELRCSEAAQWEIRGVANEILRQLHEVEPGLFPARETQ